MRFTDFTSIRDAFGHPMALISGYRHERPLEENQGRNNELQEKIDEAGYHALKVRGFWEGQTEESFLIIARKGLADHRFVADLRSWMEQFDQEAVIVKNGQSDDAILIFANGKQRELGSWKHEIMPKYMH